MHGQGHFWLFSLNIIVINVTNNRLLFCQNCNAVKMKLVSVCFPGEMNNGIKKEVFGKDAARIWINDDIKMQTFPHSLVSVFNYPVLESSWMLPSVLPCWSHFWRVGINGYVNLQWQKIPGMKEEDEPEEDEEEELGHAETYAEYMPMKCKCDCFLLTLSVFNFLNLIKPHHLFGTNQRRGMLILSLM